MLTNRTGQTMKALGTDRRGEHISSSFEECLRAHGTQHQLSVWYSPQLNGVAERYNRTICELAGALVIDSNLPKHFWAEAVSTVIYV